MPAGFSEINSSICPDCGALIIGGFCARCGYINTVEDIDDKPSVEEVSERSSIFEEPISKTKKKLSQDIKKRMSKGRYLILILLFLLLGGLCSYYYWLYQDTADVFLAPTPDFTIANSDEGLLVDVDQSGETIIDYDIQLAEGNFLQHNLAQFAAPEVGVFLQMFGTYDFLNKFYEESVTAKYFKDLGLEQDDLNVYLAPGFAVVLPDDSFDRWGYASAIVDKKYIDEKVAALEKLRAKDKAYENLFASVVTIKTEKTPEQIAQEDSEKEDEDASEDDTSSENSVDSNIIETHYLLVSNSKEYLDQMKEVSEGVLPNLSSSALFAQAQKELPAIGNVMIHHNKQVDFSTEFYDWFASKFEYEGLNRLLSSIKSSTVVLYSQSGKLKIAGISDL